MKLIWLTMLVAAGSALLAQAASPAHGTYKRIQVHGKSLDGNLEGDTADPYVSVYLPPSYATSPNRRYPVLYLLHGYTNSDDGWFGPDTKSAFKSAATTMPEVADQAIAAGAREMIIVMPNAYTKYEGSMYSSSPTTGDWETYITHDLVSYIDRHYRTIPNRASRGLAGHSMGGYGTIRLAMKYPGLYSSVYILSACCLTANLNPGGPALAQAEAIHSPADLKGAGRGVMTMFAEAAAWSPNPMNPPFFFDLPVREGKPRPEVVARWVANAPLAMLDQYSFNLKKLDAIAMDVGNKDGLAKSNEELSQQLTQLGIQHTFETYDGNHTDHIAERVRTKVLPFFSEHLSFGSER